MPKFTISQAFPTGRTSDWTTQTGETIVFDLWSVQFVEAPGMVLEIGQTKKAGALSPGMQLDGTIEQGKRGAYFKKAPRPQNQGAAGGGNRYGGGGRTDDTQKYIIAQCALKCAIEMSKAQEKYDTAFIESAMAICWELIHKYANRQVDAPPAPAAPMAAPVPQMPQMPQMQIPQQYQQAAYAHAGNGNGFGNEEIPF